MRKKWTYVAIVSMMLGVAPVFTGCVDTDEPAGINELRGAKAELLRAKAAVEQANAQWVLADAQYREALARHENALAAQAEYEAEKRKLEAEMMAAQNEKDKIWLQKEIELIQQEMERNAIVHQQTMLQLQMNFEQTRLAYEQLMKEIEIAEATGNGVPTSIADLKRDVQEKYAKLYGGSYTNSKGDAIPVPVESSLYYLLQQAQERVYNISLNHANGIVDSNGSKYIPMLKLHVADAEAKVAAEKEALQKLQDFLKNDVETTDWRAEIEELEAALEDIKKAVDAKNVELEKAKNSESYLALAHALYGVYGNTATGGTTNVTGVEGTMADEYPVNWEAAAQDGAWQVYKRAEKDLYTLKVETEFTLEGDKMETEVSNALNTLLQGVEKQLYQDANPGATTPAPTTDWQKGLVYDDITYRYYYKNPANNQESTPSFDVEKGEYPSTVTGVIDVKDLFGSFQHWKEVLAAATENNYQNAIEIAKLEKSKLEAKIKDDYQPEYNQAVKDWEIALKAYSKGEASDITAHTDYAAIKKVFTDYNNQYVNLESAIATYNKTYSEKYTEAYNKYISDDFTPRMYLIGLDKAGLDDMQGFDLVKARAEVAKVQVETRANYEAAILAACFDVQGGISKESAAANVMAAIESFVSDAQEKDDTLMAAAKAAGETAAKNAANIVTVNTAVTNLQTAADALDDAFVEFDELAATPFGQLRTAAAKTASATDVLIGIYDEEAKKYVLEGGATAIAGYVEEVDEKTGAKTGNLEIAVSKIEDAEITKAIAAEVDEATAKTAWHTTSDNAFGNRLGYADLNYRATEPTAEEILDAATITGDINSAGYKYAFAQSQVGEYDEAINQVADLGKLKAEVDAAYDALVKEFQTKYDEAFAGAEKALDDAAEKLLAADAALVEAGEAFATIEAEIAELEAKYNAQSAVKNTLIEAVKNNLGIVWPEGSGVSGTYDPDKFEDELDQAVAYQEKVVANAEYSLAQLKIQLTQAEDGKFDDLSYAQMQLTVATNEFNVAWEAYQEALENLQKGLAVAADEAEEEQPAE